jgi:hypothetical protein
LIPIENGSRGVSAATNNLGLSSGTMRKIESYFGLNVAAMNNINNSNGISNEISTNTRINNYNESLLNGDGNTDTILKREKENYRPVSLLSSKATMKSNQFVNVTQMNTIQQLQQQLEEMKKRGDLYKAAKEQCDMKYSRLENDHKTMIERNKKLDEKNIRLRKLIEEIYRDKAKQDARRKRDRLALECVRLGKQYI